MFGFSRKPRRPRRTPGRPRFRPGLEPLESRRLLTASPQLAQLLPYEALYRAGDNTGRSVAMDGDIAVAGAPNAPSGS